MVLEDVAPTLAIETPARGTFLDGDELVVTGRAADDGAVAVTVNGTAAALQPDGSFAVTVPALGPGLFVIETHASDATGHDVRDVRAVLVGPFAPSDGTTRAPIAVRAGTAALASFGDALATADFAAAAKAANPVFNKPGCLGARVDITDVTIGKVTLALAPRQGALDAIVTADDVDVKLALTYEVACLDGSTTATVRTKARITGQLAGAIVGGRIRTTLSRSSVTLDAFDADIIGVPDRIESVLRGGVRIGIEIALARIVASELPKLADAQLAALFARPASAQVLGRATTISTSPRSLDITSAGVGVSADLAFLVAGGETGRYVARALPALVAPASDDLAIAISPAAIDQLLAGLWAAKAFDRTITRADLGPLGMFLDERIAEIELAFSLPPVTSASGATPEIAVGDLIVILRDVTGGELQRLAVTLRTTLAIAPGEASLSTAQPTVFAQSLAAAPGAPLDGAGVEQLIRSVWSLVGGSLDDALTRIAVPGVPGAIQIRSVGARDGAIVLDVAMLRP